MDISELIRQSIEDSEKWREGNKPGSKTRSRTSGAVRGGSPERANRPEEPIRDSNESPRPGRIGAMVRVIGYIPHLKGE